MSTITATSLQTSYPPILPKQFSSNQPQTIRLYPLSNYTFGTKENQPEEDPSVLARLKRLEEHYEHHGMRRTCEGVLVCHEHNHPHILMLQIANAFFKLPGDYLLPEDDEAEGFKTRLNERLAPVGTQFSGEGVNDEWQVGDTLAQWWRPNFETFMYPFLPAHVTRPKECKKLYFIQLPKSKVLSVPKNMKLLAVPLFELYDNTARYGPQLAAIPHLLSRYNFEFVDEEGKVSAVTPGGEQSSGGIKVLVDHKAEENGENHHEDIKQEGMIDGMENARTSIGNLNVTSEETLTMLLIGLTGSIATGKSTVSQILSQPPYFLPVIDADLLARKVVEPGTRGYNAICGHFLSTTPDLLLPPSNGSTGRPLNRPALGRRVFGDSPERKRDRNVLNGIVHPAVRWEMFKAVVSYYTRGYWAVVLDIPLLFESRLDIYCGVVMVVAVQDSVVQMQRLRERDGHLSEEEARNRVGSQVDVRVKARRAERRGQGRGVVVWNDEGKEELEEGIGRCMEKMKRGSPKWWSWVLLGLPFLAGTTGVWSLILGWWTRRRWEAEERREKAKL